MIYEELEKFFASVGTGMRRVFVEDENGYNRLTTEANVEAQALGPAEMFGAGAKPDIYALSQAAGAPVTEAEVAGTMAGFGPGKLAGAIGAPGDIAALATGIYKAAFPEPEQGRLEAFITQVEEISNKFGSGATLGFLDDWATQSGISEEAKQGFLQGAELGSFFGFGQGAKATGKGVVAAGKAVVEGAPARIAERSEGVTLGMGVDPMAPIDEAIVGAQKALQKPAKNVDEARAAYETSPNDPALRQQYLDLRRARDAELSQMPVSEQLELDTSYRMQHQPKGPQDGGGRLDDITAGGELFPDDVYSANGLRFYGNPNNSFDRQSHAAILSARGNPEAEITIYRAVPTNVDQINTGDWVTLSPDYAAMHAGNGYGPNGNQAGKVISKKVKVKDVFSDGNDLNEFGYFPEDLTELGVKKVVPPKETEPGIIAFHGSGADFDEFSLEKIGTGEGAQAYGYGLYFTDSEDIAKFYRDSVGGANVLKRAENIKIANPDGGQETAANFSGFRNKFAKYYGDNAALFADRYLGQFTIEPDASEDVLIQRAIDTMNAVKESDKIPDNPKEIISKITLPDRGKMYKVGLEPKPEDMLDYDAPFSEQSKDVQEKLLKAGYKVDANTSGSGGMILDAIMSDIAKKETAPRNARLDEINAELKVLAKEIDKYSTTGYRNFTDPKGEAAAEKYDALMDERANLPKFSKSDARKIASEKIAKAGIPGIKYKAAGSRSAGVDDAAAERNYVIFDDKAIKILEKYGIVGPVAITALGAAKQEGEDNANST